MQRKNHLLYVFMIMIAVEWNYFWRDGRYFNTFKQEPWGSNIFLLLEMPASLLARDRKHRRFLLRDSSNPGGLRHQGIQKANSVPPASASAWAVSLWESIFSTLGNWSTTPSSQPRVCCPPPGCFSIACPKVYHDKQEQLYWELMTPATRFTFLPS